MKTVAGLFVGFVACCLGVILNDDLFIPLIGGAIGAYLILSDKKGYTKKE